MYSVSFCFSISFPITRSFPECFLGSHFSELALISKISSTLFPHPMPLSMETQLNTPIHTNSCHSHIPHLPHPIYSSIQSTLPLWTHLLVQQALPISQALVDWIELEEKEELPLNVMEKLWVFHPHVSFEPQNFPFKFGFPPKHESQVVLERVSIELNLAKLN